MSPWWLLAPPAGVAFLLAAFVLGYWRGTKAGFAEGFARGCERGYQRGRRHPLATPFTVEDFVKLLDEADLRALDDDGPPERPEVTH